MDEGAEAPRATAPTATRAAGAARGAPRPFVAGDLVVGRFRIVREIAEGGMAVVYEVLDEKLHERRALKCAKPGFAQHLPPEARSSLRVTHRNVCRVFEIHPAETPFGRVDALTMEYLEGGTLAAELRARGALPEPEARDIATQICAGVQAAHGQGLLHRDLKSHNVLLTRDHLGRRAVVTDFGLAQEPSASAEGPAWSGVAGTPAYLAPERWRGERATVASDIFALGVLLHEIASGRLPEDAFGERVLARDLPRRWRTVIARCVNADPSLRYSSASDVADALADRSARRRAALWSSAALTVLALGIWQVFFPPALAARLALLPLETASSDPQTAELVRGTSYDLSERLMRRRPRPRQLVVIPVEETRTLRGSDAGEARQQLGASHILRGTMTRLGDRLIVRGSIVDTTTKVALRNWSEEYPVANAAAVAPAISAIVGAAFRLPHETANEHVSPAAYPAYVEGMSALRGDSSGHERAIAAFERAIALDPESVLPMAGLAEACYDAWVSTADPRWLTRGRDALARAEELSADSIAVRLAAGRLNLVKGSYDQAVREYQRVVLLDPMSGEGWNGLGRAFQAMQGHDTEAVEAYLKALDVQPGYYAPHNSLGEFFRLRGNYTGAAAQWAQVIALAPGLLEGHANLGGLYIDMGRYADAERELGQALAIDARSRSVLNNFGALYQYMGRDADAAAYLERARTVGPDTHILMLNLGDSYRRLGRGADATAAYLHGRELAEPILRNNPRDAATRAFLAYFALRLGDAASAEYELAQALSSDPDNRTVVRRAAICYEALGDRDRTLAVLASASPDLLRELNRQPDVAGLRTDPRFVALLRTSNVQ